MCSNGLEGSILGPFGAQYGGEKQANKNLLDKTYRIINDTRTQTDKLQAVREQQMASQSALQNESNANFANTTAGFSPEQQQRQLEEQSASATSNLQLSPQFTAATQPLNTSNGAPAIVQQAIDKRLAQSADKANTYATNLGGLEGYNMSNFMNNLAVTKLAQDQATKGTLAQSMGNVANEADSTRNLLNQMGQQKLAIWEKQNKEGGIRQMASINGAIGKAALFAALMA